MSKSLLSEAIADANDLMATAKANARLAIEEAFQPTIRSMISNRLSEEEGEEEFEDDGGDINIDINTPEDEFAPEGEEDSTGFDSFSDDESTEDVPEEEPTTEGSDEEMELEALIRELDGDEEMMDENTDGEDAYDALDEGDGYEDDELAEGEEFDADSVDDVSLDEEMDGEDAYNELEEALNALIREELGSGDGLGDDLDLGPNTEDGDAFTDHSLPTNPAVLERRKLRKENKRLKGDLNEAYKVVTKLKKTLNEVNLLNAKLMFTTKTFKAFPLNEAQQQRVLDAFDRANSVREVKLIYATIHESQNKKPLKKITEGLASKSVKAINPKKNGTENRANVIEEGNIVRWDPRRLQQLANIKPLKD